MPYLVWVGGVNVYDEPCNKQKALIIKQEYVEQGYDDVIIQKVTQ